jgi:hypothetical protein
VLAPKVHLVAVCAQTGFPDCTASRQEIKGARRTITAWSANHRPFSDLMQYWSQLIQPTENKQFDAAGMVDRAAALGRGR